MTPRTLGIPKVAMVFFVTPLRQHGTARNEQYSKALLVDDCMGDTIGDTILEYVWEYHHP